MGISKIANLRIIKEQHRVMLLMMAMLKDVMYHADREMPYSLTLNQEEKLDKMIYRVEKLIEKEEKLIFDELTRIRKSATKGHAVQG